MLVGIEQEACTADTKTQGGGEWERHRVVIAAAVAAFLGEGASIRSIRAVSLPSKAWTRQGRIALQTSHNLSKRSGPVRELPDRGTVEK